MPTANRYENWHSGVYCPTIMSGAVVRWKHASGPYEISASRNGVTGDMPVLNVEQLDELLEVLDEARSVHSVLAQDRYRSGRHDGREAVQEVFPLAPLPSMVPCPCARCEEGRADDAAVGG